MTVRPRTVHTTDLVLADTRHTDCSERHLPGPPDYPLRSTSGRQVHSSQGGPNRTTTRPETKPTDMPTLDSAPLPKPYRLPVSQRYVPTRQATTQPSVPNDRPHRPASCRTTCHTSPLPLGPQRLREAGRLLRHRMPQQANPHDEAIHAIPARHAHPGQPERLDFPARPFPT